MPGTITKLNKESTLMSAVSIYHADEAKIAPRYYNTEPEKVKPGTNVKGRYFEGYPAVVKAEESQPSYQFKTLKDVKARMRDKTSLAVDVYLPDKEGERFPSILAYGMWGKDNNEVVFWLRDYPMRYDGPWWDGNLEVGDIGYFASRGYAFVIPDPRGVGKSEGQRPRSIWDLHNAEDEWDTVEWIAKQPWSDGKVGMIGPSSYSLSQYVAAINPPPHLAAVFPIGAFYPPSDPFTGMIDMMLNGIIHGGHIHDSGTCFQWGPPMSPETLPKEEYDKRLAELLENPDIKFHPKWRSKLVYPQEPVVFDYLMGAFHPGPVDDKLDRVTLPFYVGLPAPGGGGGRLYSGGYEAYNKIRSEHKKFLITYPGEFARPFVEMQYEILRWYDHWLKGMDNGIMDEPPVKLFVGGTNRYKFEDEWPPAGTTWGRLYLHAGNRLSRAIEGPQNPDHMHQPMPLKSPVVYSLNYFTEPFERDTEMIGPAAFYLEAAVDKDDINWMVKVVDVDPEGGMQLMSEGWLKGSFRALDEGKSKPWSPVHVRQDPVPIPIGKSVKYAINLMPIVYVMQKGHTLGVIIRTQDDMFGQREIGGLYFLNRMVDATVDVHLGPDSYLVFPEKEN